MIFPASERVSNISLRFSLNLNSYSSLESRAGKPVTETGRPILTDPKLPLPVATFVRSQVSLLIITMLNGALLLPIKDAPQSQLR
jgi:hypothetical protein